MDNASKETLATLERLIVRDAVSVHAAIQAAYRLGVVDGQLEMAALGQRALEGVGPSMADIHDCDCNTSPHLKSCSIKKNLSAR